MNAALHTCFRCGKILPDGVTGECNTDAEQIVSQFNFDNKKCYLTLEDVSHHELVHWSKWMREF